MDGACKLNGARFIREFHPSLLVSIVLCPLLCVFVVPQAYLELARQVDMAVQFMNAAGLQSSSPIMAETEFYVSHEALLLDYEQALTRLDSTTDRWCVCRVAAARRQEGCQHFDQHFGQAEGRGAPSSLMFAGVSVSGRTRWLGILRRCSSFIQFRG